MKAMVHRRIVWLLLFRYGFVTPPSGDSLQWRRSVPSPPPWSARLRRRGCRCGCDAGLEVYLDGTLLAAAAALLDESLGSAREYRAGEDGHRQGRYGRRSRQLR